MAEQHMNSWLVGLAVIAVLGVILVAVVKTTAPITIDNSYQDDVLSVSGTKQLEVPPDQAVIILQVVTDSMRAKDASTENKALLTKVMVAIEGQGVKSEELETVGVTLEKVTEWDPKTQMSVDKGYRQTVSLKVTLSDLDKVGAVLDAAVNAGANSVQSVSFRLKPATEERYKQEALKAAAQIARDKATLLADASGATLGKLSSVSENSYVTPYYYNSKVSYDMVAAEEMGSTPISPEKVSLTASVNLNYELA